MASEVDYELRALQVPKWSWDPVTIGMLDALGVHYTMIVHQNHKVAILSSNFVANYECWQKAKLAPTKPADMVEVPFNLCVPKVQKWTAAREFVYNLLKVKSVHVCGGEGGSIALLEDAVIDAIRLGLDQDVSLLSFTELPVRLPETASPLRLDEFTRVLAMVAKVTYVYYTMSDPEGESHGYGSGSYHQIVCRLGGRVPEHYTKTLDTAAIGFPA